MARDLAKAARDVAKAMDADEPKKATAAAKRMSALGKDESDLIDSLNVYCSGKKWATASDSGAARPH